MKMFKAYALEADTIFPKAMPQTFQNIVILKGNGGPGTIKQLNFAKSTKFKYVKERIEVIDSENSARVTSLFEGDDGFSKFLEKITSKLKFEATPDGGSIYKSIDKYYPVGDQELSEDKVKDAQEFFKLEGCRILPIGKF